MGKSSSRVYDPAIHHRRSIRLRGHDYSSRGVYFVTICVKNRRPLFGTVVNGRMVLNDIGRNAISCWRDIPNHFPRAAWCNQYVLHVADTVVIGRLNSDGMLACLLSDLPCDKTVAVL